MGEHVLEERLQMTKDVCKKINKENKQELKQKRYMQKIAGLSRSFSWDKAGDFPGSVDHDP